MYKASDNRYDSMIYRRAGKTGLKLPVIALGLWHNFGNVTQLDTSKKLVQKAFDLGITHFDLANNYGPPAGSAESNFGKILREDMKPYRDELIISTKAGYDMWQGPYGDYGSRKYLMASVDQSLERLGLDYVDIFYHHRPDPDTPIEETMLALDQIVRQGKALYVGISNYNSKQATKALGILKAIKTPVVLTQPSYSMFNRWVEEDGLLDVTEAFGVGNIVFSPLSQGLLTNKYIDDTSSESKGRSARDTYREKILNQELLDQINKLNDIAKERGQSLAQLALSWVLRDDRVTTALVGASKVSQIEDSGKASENLEFSPTEIEAIEAILK